MERSRIYKMVIVAFAVVIVARLFYIQIIDSSYKRSADNNALRHEVLYPMRGEVYDRNGEFLVQSKEAYDLMVVPKDVEPFDTLLLCNIISATPEQIRKALQKAKRYSERRSSELFKGISKEAKLRFEEHRFRGFYMQYRTVRSYPRKIAGNLLGDVGEVGQSEIDRDPYYRSGDYIGKSGIERSYEHVLRGEKGMRIQMVDVHGVAKGSYAGGVYDTAVIQGRAITCTIDAKLQALGEELMKGKIGSIVAIDPGTGEILAMVSSPTYDPDELVGRERGNNYMKLQEDNTKPLFNRAVMSRYPPGSTFKLVNGLIGLQEGVLKPEQKYSCSHGYTVGKLTVGCHSHGSPLNLYEAIQTSCNAYFCYVFRDVIDNKAFNDPKTNNVRKNSPRGGFAEWDRYVRSFGFGRKLDSDFLDELSGYVPDVAYMDKTYDERWNSLTCVSLAIGQSELGVTPLQLANFYATIANRGYYYIPHVVKAIDGQDSIDARFYEKHHSLVEAKHFNPVIEGMWRAVNLPGGTGYYSARVDGLDICGKTGTAQNGTPRNPRPDHSTFACFAPRNNPRIVVSVYIEHGGFGATVAAPIASLLVEQYLTGEVERPDVAQRVKSHYIPYTNYGGRR